jgi:peptidoglycan/LPS O-acetylase OafA/YrhL
MGEPKPAQQRYTLVDALRGVAAFAVLCHHLFHNSALERPLWNILPFVVCEFCHFGSFGVQIFFVLSGFVIPHSLRNVKLDRSGLGNFFIRRQLRLDPPYWTIIILTVISANLEHMMPWINKQQIPTFVDSIINLFYLQNIVNVQQVVPVAWTLCLEVQFYLIFILLLVCGKFRNTTGSQINRVSVSLVTIIGLGSMVIPGHTIEQWFIQWWYYFAAGVLCYWTTQQPKLRPLFYVYMACFLVCAIIGDPPSMLTGWCTVALLHIAGERRKLTSWLDFRWIQYLGRISYSLYLVHLLVATYVLRIGYRLTGDSPGFALFWFILALAFSIVCAQGLYWAVESRSIKLAASLKGRTLRGAGPVNGGPAEVNGASIVPGKAAESI